METKLLERSGGNFDGLDVGIDVTEKKKEEKVVMSRRC
jgi:uncharacterized protein YifE (UPF0438 family)